MMDKRKKKQLQMEILIRNPLDGGYSGTYFISGSGLARTTCLEYSGPLF